MISGIDNIVFRQNQIHGSAPIAQSYSSTKACTLFGDCEIPNMHNKTSVDLLIADIYNDIYINTEIDTLFENICLINYYSKTEIDDTDNELSTLILNFYIQAEIDTFLTDYYNTEYINTRFDVKATSLNTYTTSEIDNIITLLDISYIYIY